MKLQDAWWEWTPTNLPPSEEQYASTVGKVRVSDRSEPDSVEYLFSGGSLFKEDWGWMGIALMMADFHKIVVRDGLDPQVVHEEFLKIDDYRQLIATDVPRAGRCELWRRMAARAW